MGGELHNREGQFIFLNVFSNKQQDGNLELAPSLQVLASWPGHCGEKKPKVSGFLVTGFLNGCSCCSAAAAPHFTGERRCPMGCSPAPALPARVPCPAVPPAEPCLGCHWPWLSMASINLHLTPACSLHTGQRSLGHSSE